MVLHWAAANNRLCIAKRALSVEEDINAIDGVGRTALWIAADKGHADMVALLLALDGIDVHIEAECGLNRWNALFQACWKKRDKAIDIMIKSGKFDPNATCSTGWTPLQKSAMDKRFRSVKVLLASGKVDVNVRGKGGGSSFDAARFRGQDRIGIMLVHAGLDVTGKIGGLGRTALHLAATSMLMQCVKELINMKGVDVNAKDDLGMTPLHVACTHHGRKEVVRLLVNAPGIDTEAKAEDGRTPLQTALAHCFRDTAKVLGWKGR